MSTRAAYTLTASMRQMAVLQEGVTLLLLLSMAAAEPLLENPVFEVALASYRELEFERARVLLDELDGEGERFSKKDRALLQLWRGIVLTQLSEPAMADAALDRALALSPSIVVPGDAPPAVVQRVQTLQAKRIETLEDKETPPIKAPVPVAEPSAASPNGAIGMSLLVGGGISTLAGASMLIFVDSALGEPADFSERQTLSGVAGAGAILAGVGLIAAGAGAGLLWIE